MKFWPLADLLLLLSTEWRRPPWYIWFFGSWIGLTFLWSTDPLAPLLFSLRIYMLWSVVTSKTMTRKTPLFIGVLLGGLVSLFGTWRTEFPYFDGVDYRYSFQYDNPELAGLAGLTVFMTPFAGVGALLAGFAGSRAAVLVMVMWAGLYRTQPLILGAIIALAMLWFIRPDAFTLSETKQTIEYRQQTIENPVEEAPIIADNRILKFDEYPLGFGYHSFNDRTGFQTPHNIYILILREMGALFTAAILLFVIHVALRYRRQWKLILPIGVYLVVTDSLWYFPAGHYAAALFVILIGSKRPLFMYKEKHAVNYHYGHKGSGDIV